MEQLIKFDAKLLVVPTSNAILNCLEVVVQDANADEGAMVASGVYGKPSQHDLLRPFMYCFLGVQFQVLPDISHRLARLISTVAQHLQPWQNTAAACPSTHASVAAEESSGPADVWEWAHFVRRNFFLYARLLTFVVNGICSSRFSLHVEELQSVASLFETPQLLPLLRDMSS